MANRSSHDVDALLIAWCGALGVVHQVHVDVRPRRRLAGVALGVALLILANLIKVEGLVVSKCEAVVGSVRRVGARIAQHERPNPMGRPGHGEDRD
jgi:hypothetical protein